MDQTMTFFLFLIFINLSIFINVQLIKWIIQALRSIKDEE